METAAAIGLRARLMDPSAEPGRESGGRTHFTSAENVIE